MYAVCVAAGVKCAHKICTCVCVLVVLVVLAVCVCCVRVCAALVASFCLSLSPKLATTKRNAKRQLQKCRAAHKIHLSGEREKRAAKAGRARGARGRGAGSERRAAAAAATRRKCLPKT